MAEIDPTLIPEETTKWIAAATIGAMRRIQRKKPELWAEIKALAAKLRAESG